MEMVNVIHAIANEIVFPYLVLGVGGAIIWKAIGKFLTPRGRN